MAQHNEYGSWGEDVAAEYIQSLGYTIIERNWRFGHKEIDIIATNGHLLLFVEVKARKNAAYGNPYEAVDWRKRKNLMAAMNHYVVANCMDVPVRYDIVSVLGTPGDYTIEILENAVSNFSLSD